MFLNRIRIILNKSLSSGFISSSSPSVEKFEKNWAKYCNRKYGVSVSNGTVAMRLALYLIGVKKNDEVLIPPLSFVATANAISHLGAEPHFIDIDKLTKSLTIFNFEDKEE